MGMAPALLRISSWTGVHWNWMQVIIFKRVIAIRYCPGGSAILNLEPDILFGIWMTGWAMERKESVEGKKLVKEKK